MKDARAMAYVNMYGVLGTLENLCALDGKAKEILAGLKKPVSLCLEVKGGPCCTFHFTREGCRMTEGSEGCTCKMRFASPEKFNDLIDHSKPGLPVKGAVQLLSFLLGPFTKLTNRLTELLRPSEEAMRERAFFEESTILTMYTVAGAISALANNDPISKLSASYTVDGDVSLGIKDVVKLTRIIISPPSSSPAKSRASSWNLPTSTWRTGCSPARPRRWTRCAAAPSTYRA